MRCSLIAVAVVVVRVLPVAVAAFVVFVYAAVMVLVANPVVVLRMFVVVDVVVVVVVVDLFVLGFCCHCHCRHHFCVVVVAAADFWVVFLLLLLIFWSVVACDELFVEDGVRVVVVLPVAFHTELTDFWLKLFLYNTLIGFWRCLNSKSRSLWHVMRWLLLNDKNILVYHLPGCWNFSCALFLPRGRIHLLTPKTTGEPTVLNLFFYSFCILTMNFVWLLRRCRLWSVLRVSAIKLNQTCSQWRLRQ